MSIPVALPELPDALAAYPWGYLLTVRDDLRAQSLAVPTQWRDGALQMSAGAGTRANAVARPQVSMVFPSPTPGEYSLIVDGTAAVHDDGITVAPTWAVLHRPAIS
ncbi:MAG: pyridoxamine 5'-phosphate oxidase family protein [Actinobacteria bacterium]|nr:pyridoxamine 5'-phosphate oxidase family protein [Actinomycetota bacterium]